MKASMKTKEERAMSEVAYTSRVRIERLKGPLRIAYLPGEARPVTFSVHGAIAAHYKVDPADLTDREGPRLLQSAGRPELHI